MQDVRRESLNGSVLRLSSAEISNSSITEFQGEQPVLSIPRDQIHSISLRYGIKAERPILNVLIGGALIAVGVYIIWPFVWQMVGPLFFAPGSKPAPRFPAIRFAVLCLMLIPVGFFILQGLQRRYFLLITTQTGGKRKIVFDQALPYNEIRSFIENVRAEFGYDIVLRTRE